MAKYLLLLKNLFTIHSWTFPLKLTYLKFWNISFPIPSHHIVSICGLLIVLSFSFSLSDFASGLFYLCVSNRIQFSILFILSNHKWYFNVVVCNPSKTYSHGTDRYRSHIHSLHSIRSLFHSPVSICTKDTRWKHVCRMHYEWRNALKGVPIPFTHLSGHIWECWVRSNDSDAIYMYFAFFIFWPLFSIFFHTLSLSVSVSVSLSAMLADGSVEC